MNTSTKIKVGAIVAAALAVAGGGVAVAAADAWSPSEEAKAVIDDAALELGVEPDELSDALKQALKNRVDEAVAAGRLTEEQGARLKERIDSSDVPLPLGVFGPKGFGDHVAPFGSLSNAATYLGLTETELRSRLADDKTLAEIARDEGKSVDGLVQALVSAAKEKIDAAVDAGKLTKAQADEIKADLEDRTRDLIDGANGFGDHFGWRGPGFDFRGPKFDDGFRGFRGSDWLQPGPSA
jgi:predicted DNA-binding protein (UPF0251 family)